MGRLYLRWVEENGRLNVNSEAIYESRTIASYNDGKVYLTKKTFMHFIFPMKMKQPPSKIWLNSIQPAEDSDAFMLGVKEEQKADNGFVVDIPNSVQIYVDNKNNRK